jgi:DNA-binding beta-propeller fold protein YncE
MITRSIALVGVAAALSAQQIQFEPTNKASNPYQTVAGWAKLPEGRTWGALSAVEIDPDGVSIWVAERCGTNWCGGSNLPPIMKFDSTGKLVKAFGEGMVLSPHGIFVDRQGNIWVTDCTCTRPRGEAVDSTKGHQVYKFSPDGKLLMTLGKAGGAREPGYFWQPNDVLVAKNGDIFVAEGHASGADANARILKFDKKGKFLKAWGHKGTGAGEMDQPHALAMDSKGRLFVGDRGNNRILILDQNFKILGTWYQFSRPSGIYIDKKDNIYVADSESGSVAPGHKDWYRGIRVGSAKNGTLVAFIPDPNVDGSGVGSDTARVRGTSSAEGVAADARGNIYGAEVGQRALKRYVRKP